MSIGDFGKKRVRYFSPFLQEVAASSRNGETYLFLQEAADTHVAQLKITYT